MYYSKPLMSYEAICQVLDDAAEVAGRPLDWRKPLYAAIDELHAAAAPEEQIRIAERISILLLQLDWAILRRDSDKAAAARSELAELGETWRALVGAEPLDMQDFVSPEPNAPVAFDAAAESRTAPAELETGTSDHFQTPSSIDFQAFRSGPLRSERIDAVEVGQVAGGTAAQAAQAERERRVDEARESLQADPFVRSLIDDLGGRIVPDSIRPAD